LFKTYFTAVRGFSRNARLFLFTLGLATLIIDGVYAVIFNLFLLRLGYDAAFVGQINAAGLLTFAVASLPAGELGKRWGSRRAMIAGLWLVFGGSLALPWAGIIAAWWEAAWLYVSYIIMFLGYALFFVNGVPFLMASTSETERDHAFSAQTAIFSLAAFSGGLLGGLLPGIVARLTGLDTDATLPYRVPLLVAALMLLPGMVTAMRTEQNRPAARQRSRIKPLLRISAADRAYLGLLFAVAAVRVLQVAGTASANTFFNVYMDQGLAVPTAQIGAVTATARLASVPAAMAVAALTARWGHRALVIASGLGTAVALLPLALVPQWGAAASGFISVIIFAAIRYPAFLVYSMKLVNEEQRGTMSGLSEMTAGIGFSAMALLGGYVITRYGYTTHFLIGAACVMLGTLLFAAYFRKPRGELAGHLPLHGAAD
jgi:MFS family permease